MAAQTKDRKYRYFNTGKKMKAASAKRGFRSNSKIYLKSKNRTVWIIDYSPKNCTLFFRQPEVRNGGK